MPVLRGKLLDWQGQPIPAGTVYFLAGPVPLPDIAVRTDASGGFALTVPVPGRYCLGARAAGFAAGELVVDVGHVSEVQVELTLQPDSTP
jgi:hypothetical protein